MSKVLGIGRWNGVLGDIFCFALRRLWGLHAAPRNIHRMDTHDGSGKEMKSETLMILSSPHAHAHGTTGEKNASALPPTEV